MTRRTFVLFFILLSQAGQPLPAAEDTPADAAGSGQMAGQASANTDKADSGKTPGNPKDEEPECD